MSIYTFLALAAVFAVCTTGWTQDNRVTDANAERHEAANAIVSHFMQTGLEEYRQGYYEQAERTLTQALEYRQYLDAKTQDELDKLLERARRAKEERNKILEVVRNANQLVADGKLGNAKEKLELVRYSEYLNAEERDLIAEGLKKLDVQVSNQRKEVAEIYNRSIDLYKAGELEKAREGFVKIVGNDLLVPPDGQKAEDYIAKIDAQSAQKVAVPEKKATVTGKATADILETVPVPARDNKLARPVVDAGADNYIEKVNQKMNVIKGHTKAVVSDANEKADNFIDAGQFVEARAEIENAQRLINENQFNLSKDLYKEYNDKLTALRIKVDEREIAKKIQQANIREKDAGEAQRKFREDIEKEKKQRVKDLMDRAKDYQKQQRYEEALGQLEILLSIDPMHNEALLLKQTLDDTVNFRKQLEVQKEGDKERVGILRETDSSGIPYASEITHPKNWREIIEKPTRQPKGIIGQDRADKETYEHLDKEVDLPRLSPLMGLAEALEEIKNSVSPPLKMFVNWRDLRDNAGVEETTEIKMIDAMAGVPLKAALEPC